MESAKPDPFQKLPDEIILEIFKHATPEDLLALSQVSKRISRLAQVKLGDIETLAETYRQANPIRAEGILKANPNISKKDFVDKMVQSVKEDCVHFSISMKREEILKGNELKSLEQQIQDAALIEFTDILIEKKALNLDFGEEKSPSQKAKTIRAFLSNPDNLQNINSLELSGAKLKLLPPEIGHFISLEDLNLSRNPLTALPESFTKLPNLLYLYLANSQLANLPENIGNIGTLQILDLDNTALKSLPESIKNLDNITELHALNLKLDEGSIKILNELKNDSFRQIDY